MIHRWKHYWFAPKTATIFSIKNWFNTTSLKSILHFEIILHMIFPYFLVWYCWLYVGYFKVVIHQSFLLIADLSFIGKSLKTLLLTIFKDRNSQTPIVITDMVSSGVSTDGVTETYRSFVFILLLSMLFW